MHSPSVHAFNALIGTSLRVVQEEMEAQVAGSKSRLECSSNGHAFYLSETNQDCDTTCAIQGLSCPGGDYKDLDWWVNDCT